MCDLCYHEARCGACDRLVCRDALPGGEQEQAVVTDEGVWCFGCAEVHGVWAQEWRGPAPQFADEEWRYWQDLGGEA